MENNFITGFDKPKWRANSPALTAHAAGGGIAYDERNKDPFPYIFQLASATVLNVYSKVTDERQLLKSPALTGVFGAGAFCIMKPSAGPTGTISAGATTTKFALTTALPASVGINQIANRGDGIGFRIRIIDNGAGGSGKIAERRVIANTAGTTPTIVVDEALGFTPVSGSAYEFVSPRIYMLSSGLLAAGSWKYYDVLTNSLSGNLSIVNLPATVSTDTTGIVTDERYVPYNRKGGEGFLVDETKLYDSSSTTYQRACLQATAIAVGSITGMATVGDFAVLADEYKNYCQIRIVEDTVNPTAVGQRRRITSHTAGPSAVYTLASNWAVTPSANCKFVIENNNDIMHLWSTATTACYTYNITANTFDTTTIPARGGVVGAGVWAEHAFSIVPDGEKNSKQGFVYSGRGGNLATIDVLDLSTRTWSNDIDYGNKGLTLFTTGTCSCKDPATNLGRYIYIGLNGTVRNQRFNMFSRTLEPNTTLRQTPGATLAGSRFAYTSKTDPTTGDKVSSIMQLLPTSATFYQLDILFELASENE